MDADFRLLPRCWYFHQLFGYVTFSDLNTKLTFSFISGYLSLTLINPNNWSIYCSFLSRNNTVTIFFNNVYYFQKINYIQRWAQGFGMLGFLVSTFTVHTRHYVSMYRNYHGWFVATNIWRHDEKCDFIFYFTSIL